MRAPATLLLCGLTACSFDWSDQNDPPEVDAGDGDGGAIEVDASTPVDTPDGSEDGCNDGFAVRGSTCVDVDECATDNGGCAHACSNTEGGFTCACDPGHSLASDGESCTPFAWSEPVLLELRDDDALRARVVVDGEGHATAVWSFGFGGVWSNRFVKARGWQGAVAVHTPAADTREVSLGVASNGDVLALWDANASTGQAVWSSRFTEQGGWAEAAQLDTESRAPRLSVRGDQAAAAWLRIGDARGRLGGSRFRQGSGWATPRTIDVGVSSVYGTPQLALGSSGSAHVTWTGRAGMEPPSAWASIDDGEGNFGAPSLLERVPTVVAEQSARIVALADGQMLAAWSQVDAAGNHQAWTARYGQDGSFASPVLLADADGKSGELTALVASESGTALAAGEGADGIWVAQFDRMRWLPARAIGEQGSAPKLAMDEQGNAVLAFMREGDIWASRYLVRTGNWTAAELVERNNFGDASLDDVAIDRAGHATSPGFRCGTVDAMCGLRDSKRVEPRMAAASHGRQPAPPSRAAHARARRASRQRGARASTSTSARSTPTVATTIQMRASIARAAFSVTARSPGAAPVTGPAAARTK